MKSSKTVINVNRTVDGLTGEVIERTETWVCKQENSYSKIYDDNVDILCAYPVPYAVFTQMAKRMTYANCDTGKQEMVLDIVTKQRIAEICNIHIKTVEKSVKTLIELGIIKKIGKTRYMINPSYAARGVWTDIVKARDEYHDAR